MNATIAVLIVLTLLFVGAGVAFFFYNKWLDKKMRSGCQGQFEALLSILIVSYVFVMVVVLVCTALAYFFGGALILSAIMIPVKFHFTWVQILLYGGALGVLFLILRFAWAQLLAKWGKPHPDVMELRN